VPQQLALVPQQHILAQEQNHPRVFSSAHSLAQVFVACFNDYIVRELGYSTPRRYYLLGGFPGFRWHYPENAFGDTSESLRAGMCANPCVFHCVFPSLFFLREWIV